MKKIALHWQILIALVLAVLFGMFFKDQVKYVEWMGTVFMRALKMVIIPLIFSSIVSGVTNIGTGNRLGKLTFKTFFYYIFTSSIAIITGLFFINLIKPGTGTDLGLAKKVEEISATKESFGDTLVNIIPTNVFEAFVENQMLSIIFFAILFGFFITKIAEKNSEIPKRFFNAVFDVMMRITMLIIRFTPLGIFGIVSAQVGESSDLKELAMGLGGFMITVSIALSIHFFISLPLILRFIAKANPLRHLKNMSTPLLTAFSTSSSNATLPLTMEAVENKSGVSSKITSFTLPLGATINMDGTALYECMAAMFIAQAYGIELSVFEQFIVVMTALLTSIGAAGIPMASLVMITVILTQVGLPLEGVGLILAVDRPLDMLRTATNVWSDSCGAVVIAKSEGESLKV